MIEENQATIPEHLEHRMRMADGRTLAVAEWGDPGGVPLVTLHGTPGGRVAYWGDGSIYARLGLRRLTIDLQGPTEVLGFPNPFFTYQPLTFFLDMLPYALVILIMVLGAREAIKRHVGAPAALGIPWVRGERGT